MNTAPKIVTRVKVFVLWRKIWDMAYLCPCISIKNVLFRIRKNNNPVLVVPRSLSPEHHISYM